MSIPKIKLKKGEALCLRTFGWVVRFDDGKRVFVQAEDIQDAIRQGH